MLITINSAEAAQPSFAGFGMGAHLHDGLVDSTLVGASGREMGTPMGTEPTAAPALPRVQWAAAISEGNAPADASDAGYQVCIQATTGIQAKTAQLNAHQLKSQQSNAQQYEHMTRVNPAFRGGVGSHPAREPEPV